MQVRCCGGEAWWQRGVVASWHRGIVAVRHRGGEASWQHGGEASWWQGVVAARQCAHIDFLGNKFNISVNNGHREVVEGSLEAY